MLALNRIIILRHCERIRLASDNAEDFKQGAKLTKASMSRTGCRGTLLKIPLC